MLKILAHNFMKYLLQGAPPLHFDCFFNLPFSVKEAFLSLKFPASKPCGNPLGTGSFVQERYGVIPLFMGSLLVTVIARLAILSIVGAFTFRK